MEKLETLLDSLEPRALLLTRPTIDDNLCHPPIGDKLPAIEHFFSLLNSLELITSTNTTTY